MNDHLHHLGMETVLMCLQNGHIVSIFINVQSNQITTDFFYSKYQKVEYIQSDGNQWIDTLFKGNQNTTFEVKCRITQGNSAYQMWPGGDMGSNTSNSIQIVFRTPGGDGSSVNNRFGGTIASLYASDTPIGTDIVVNTSKNGFILNGVSKTRTGTVGTFTTENNMRLLQVKNKNGTEGFIGRTYYSKIRDNGTLTRNFVPCYRKSDNVIGLLDIVNKVFYTNQGSGSFTKGSNVPR